MTSIRGEYIYRNPSSAWDFTTRWIQRSLPSWACVGSAYSLEQLHFYPEFFLCRGMYAAVLLERRMLHKYTPPLYQYRGWRIRATAVSLPGFKATRPPVRPADPVGY